MRVYLVVHTIAEQSTDCCVLNACRNENRSRSFVFAQQWA